MSINSFFTTYWAYITALALGAWNLYLHFKSGRTERKKNLQVAYLQLTDIINKFHVECFKLLLPVPDFMELKIGIHENKAEVTELLGKDEFIKRKELTEKASNLPEILDKLKDEYKLITDNRTKNEKLEEIKLKLNEANLVLKELREVNSKTEPFHAAANERYNEAAEKLKKFMSNKRQRAILLTKVLDDFINNVSGLAALQLVASKAIIKTISELESAGTSLIHVIIDASTEQFDIEQITKSAEFKKVLELSDEAIKQMRSEI